MEKQRIEQIRSAVELLSSISDEEWTKISAILGKETETACAKKAEEEVNQKFEKDKEKIVTELLAQLGMPSHLLGYQYFKKGLLYVLEDRMLLKGITKKLYPNLAKDFQTTRSRVERAIRHAVEVAYSRGDVELWEKVFGFSIDQNKCKPTNSEAIAGVAEYISIYML